MIISIEGNIGSGKTELLNGIATRYEELQEEMKYHNMIVLNLHKRTFPKGLPSITIIPEILPEGLKDYYKNEMDIIAGEKMMIQSKLDQWELAKEAAKKYDIVLVDSCPLSSLAFISMLKTYKRGQCPSMIVEEDSDTDKYLSELFEKVENEIFPYLDGGSNDSIFGSVELDPSVDIRPKGGLLRAVIHMITPPIVCRMRIQRRKRVGEDTIDLAGLTNLHAGYISILKDYGYYHSSRLSSCGDVDQCIEDLLNLYAFN